ncbi:MAG TPA: glycolate oxidase subunit GlcE [Steroidobacteraceae bacterium]|nr:glycolate oxidase subunit GlcE [Steroidobacteraceae bacterium]
MSSGASLREIQERVIDANRSGAPLRLRGAGTKDFYGERLEGEVLDLRSHRGVIDYEPSELVISARCGTPLSEIEALLATHGQFLAFEPPAFAGDPTIGGVIAAGLSGPRRLQVGAARDFVLGAKLLEASGEELSFGGRVMKNVAGFDVSRLLCGSLGFLGIITEVSLKVLPRPRCEQTLVLRLSAQDALAVFNRWGSLPLPISGAAWVEGSAWVRLSGAAPAVRAAGQRIGGDSVDAVAAADFWGGLRHCTHRFFDDATIWRVSVPSNAALAPGDKLLIDWGGALRWYAGESVGARARALASGAGGTALCWRGQTSGESRFHPLSRTVAQLHRRLQQHFDPRAIFNRGRLLAAEAGA